MKKIATYLAAGLLVVGAQSLMAQSSTNSVTPPSTQTPGHKDGTPEQRKDRQAMMKLLGLSKDDLKDLSPKERKAKIKETADKFVADWKAKKAGGTLTAEEQTNLDKVEKFLANAGHKKPAAIATPAPSN
jgi:hypothetical protein